MLTQASLKGLLHYDPETGVFTWLVSAGRVKQGTVAGTPKSNGYTNIMVCGKVYLAHRLAWLYVYGIWPEQDIDHINGQRPDNRICNLRQATRAENLKNSKKMSTNKSGVKGVCWDRINEKWEASACLNGKRHHLGRFDQKEDAANAYRLFAKETHGSFYRAT